MAGDGNEPHDEPEHASGGDDDQTVEDRDWREQYLDDQLDEHEGDADHGDGEGDDEVGPAPTPMGKFRHGSLGVTLGAAMTGLGNVLEPRKQEDAPVVIEHDEPDQSQDRIEMHLDRDDPGASVVIIRKWVEEHPERKPRDE
ncbi:MAG TPA: hypothetical protein VGO03_02045 [Acidimicrobiia bacterium]|jgi:hypothetical protein